MMKLIRQVLPLIVVYSASLLGQTRPSDDAIGEVFASDASVQGSVQLVGSGTRLMPGTTVSAGTSAATVRLARGGEVRVCPGTSVVLGSVLSASHRRDLMLSLGSGSLEANYSLNTSADSIITPDFRISLTGPGSFHLAIGADMHGNACVRTLTGNNASIVVSELMGDGSYQVKPSEEIYFRNGHVSDPSAITGACGCPVPVPQSAVAVASTAPAAPKPEIVTAITQSPAAVSLIGNEASKTGEIHVQVDAPFVFRAADPPPAPDENRLAKIGVKQLPPIPLPAVVPPDTVSVLANAAPLLPKEKKKGLFGRLGHFFAAIFGR